MPRLAASLIALLCLAVVARGGEFGLPEVTDPDKLIIVNEALRAVKSGEACPLACIREIIAWPETDVAELCKHFPQIKPLPSPRPTPGPLKDRASLTKAAEIQTRAETAVTSAKTQEEMDAAGDLYLQARTLLRDAYAGPKAPQEARDAWNALRVKMMVLAIRKETGEGLRPKIPGFSPLAVAGRLLELMPEKKKE